MIDNGSSITNDEITETFDGIAGQSLLPLEKYWAQADILIKNETNLGFGPACNQGFNRAHGHYVVCLNNDIIVYPGWLDALMEPLNSILTPPAGVVMPAIMKETRDARIALGMEEIDTTQNRDALSPGAEFGSCWMMKRELMYQIKEKNGGYVFDENFKIGFGEDRWLWQQVRMLGYETYRTHKTRVFHQGSMSMTKIENRKQYTIPNREYLAELKKKHNLA